MKKYAFCYDMDTNSVIKAHLPTCVLSKQKTLFLCWKRHTIQPTVRLAVGNYQLTGKKRRQCCKDNSSYQLHESAVLLHAMLTIPVTEY